MQGKKNYTRIYYFFVYWLLLISHICLGQSYETKIYGAKEGLSQGMITDICEDSDGFIWIGTLSGLNRYDGSQFKTFTHNISDPYSPIGNVVASILEDKKGRIWVGFNEGLDCYDRKTGRFYHLGNDFNKLHEKDEIPRRMCETADGHIWVADREVMIQMEVPDDFPANPQSAKKIKYHIFNSNTDLPLLGKGKPYFWFVPLANSALGISFVEENTTIFLPTIRFNRKEGKWEQMSDLENPSKLEDIPYQTFYDSLRQGHWFVKRQGMYLFKKGKITQTIPFPKSISDYGYPISIHGSMVYPDKYGSIWLLHNQNLYKITENLESKVLTPNMDLVIGEEKGSLGKIDVLSMKASKQGSLFLGTNGYGLIHITPKQMYFQSSLDKLSLTFLKQGRTQQEVLIQNGDHVCQFQPPNQYQFLSSTYQGNPYYLSNLQYSKEGTVFSQFLKIPNHLMLHVKYANGESQAFEMSNNYHALPIFLDKEGSFWMCNSMGDIACLKRGENRIEYYEVGSIWKNGEGNVEYKHFYQSQNGRLWLASQKGILEINPIKGKKPSFRLWANLTSSRKLLNSNAVLCVLDDPKEPDNYLWVGTKGGGLNKMNKQTGVCEHYTKNQGLPDNVVYGILSDKQGRIWASTNFGLACFSPNTRHFRNFTIEDGLQDDEFNTHSFYKDEDGTMYFGGINGITWFSPEQIISQQTSPPLFFTELKVNNRVIELRDSTGILKSSLEYTSNIYLKYYQNFLNISFSVLNYSNRSEDAFYYKMEGVDLDWVFSNRQKELSYPNLSPGTYVLHVTTA
ncbi:MAG: two-component regulator propeller domain-containing protein, partial [Bacteroidia bacterium]